MINITYQTKDQDGLYIEDTVVGCVCTDTAQNQDQRKQDVLRHLQYLYKALDTGPLNHQHDQGTYDTCSEDSVYNITILNEQQRTSRQTVDQETT